MPDAESQPETNGHIPINKVDNLGAIIERYSERLSELEATIEDLQQQVEAIEDTGTGPSRPNRLERVLTHAERQASNGRAVLTYKEIMAAANVSAPTAYSYMDELAEDHDAVKEEPRQDGLKRIVVDVASFNPPKKQT